MLLIPFLLVHDYLFDDQTSLEYIMQGFPGILLYIRGKRYGPSIFNCLNGRCSYVTKGLGYVLIVPP